MWSRPHALVLVAVAAGCVAAAGLGGYLAVRQNAAPAFASPADPAPAPPGAAAGAVAETEAIVDAPAAPLEVEPPPVPVPDPPPAPAHRPAKAAEPPAAPARPATPAARAEADVKGLEERWPPRPVVPPAAIAHEAGAPSGIGVPVDLAPYDPPPIVEELVVPADSVLGLQIDTSVDSERAELEDPVEAHVTRDVIVDGQVAIPAGTRARGVVTLVERGGKVKTPARLAVRFHTLVLADATLVPIQTEGIFREGDSPSDDSVKKIGGAAVGGAILGAILGGTKGAVIGGATGAGAGTAVVMAGDRDPATLQAGTTVTVRLVSPAVIVIER